RASLNCASAQITRTPSPVNRSMEYAGSTAAITDCTCSLTLAKLTRMFCTSSPNAGAPRMASARFAAASNAFEGTDPVLRLSPPIAWRSISTVGTPKAAAAAAADKPPGPAPITQISGVSMSPILPTGPALTSWRVRQYFHYHRHQRERDERCDGCGVRTSADNRAPHRD